jgi:hypothetical protein
VRPGQPYPATFQIGQLSVVRCQLLENNNSPCAAHSYDESSREKSLGVLRSSSGRRGSRTLKAHRSPDFKSGAVALRLALPNCGHEVIPEGVEPPFPLCKRGVVGRWTTGRDDSSGPPGSRTPISWLQARCRPVGPAAHPSSSTGGSRTHRHQSLELIAMPIRVPCH